MSHHSQSRFIGIFLSAALLFTTLAPVQNTYAAVPCNAGDLNCDGEIDGADLGILLGAWGSSNPSADLSQNGIVDGQDLGLFLSIWNNQMPPFVVSTIPVNGAVNVPINTNLTATFSQNMDPASLNSGTFLLQHEDMLTPGSVIYNPATKTATFVPSIPLLWGKTYTATLTTNIQNASGANLTSNYSWNFTTLPFPIPPQVVAVSPAPNATNVPITTNVQITFSKPMDPATINPVTIQLKAGANLVVGVVSYSAATNTATFNPNNDLSFSQTYTIVVTTAVKDVTGLPLPSNFVSTFTTTP